MASNWSQYNIDEPVDFQSYAYPIGGKMVVGKTLISESFKRLLEDGNLDAKKEIKTRLSTQLAEYMIDNKLVEFTYYTDQMSGSMQIAVRAYLAPDHQVKILRTVNKL